ncbi:hypothetical protein AA313_de0202153 [Arthrobotrys entomopaga]|nr:hypothetical protein AA313_de0202153 [Arthrobotrys entomopaga]
MGAVSFFLRFSFAILFWGSSVLARNHRRPPPTFPHGLSPTPRLRERQAATPTATNADAPINFETFPDLECASYCIPTDEFNWSECPITEVPCKSNPKKKCPTVDHTCYCSQPEPLYPAYYCNWFEYFQLEDWYSDQCPETPKINFDGLPSCAQQCMRDAVSNFGCVSFTRNCFCEEEWLFGCGDSCNSKDKQQILLWYGGQCLLSADEVADLDLIDPSSTPAAASISGTNPSSTGDTKNGPGIALAVHHKLHWYEIYGLIMVVLTIIFVSTIYCFIWKAEVKDIWKNNKIRIARSKHASRNVSTEKLSSPRKSKESTRKSVEKASA